MNNSADVSVVVCTCNRSNSLKNCIISLLSQTLLNFELIIINDHSNDGTSEIIENLLQYYPNKIIHTNDENMGVSYSRNTGILLASNDIVVFIDDDCVAEKYWLEEMVKPFNDKRVAVVFGHIKDPVPQNIAMVAAKGQYKRYNQEGFCNSVASGAGNMAIRKKKYLMDPIRDFTLEDWEICHKILKKGYLIYYNPNAIIIHEHYHNLKTLLKQRYRYGIGLTWYRKKYKFSALNFQMLCLIIGIFLIPFAFLNYFVLLPATIVFLLLLIYLFFKDFKKGVKTFKEAIFSFPFFLIISVSECCGRIVGLFKKPAQINYGRDFVSVKQKRT